MAGLRGVGRILLIAGLLLAAVATPANAAIYFGNDLVDRANLDGSLMDREFLRAGACGIEVDGSHIYWAENSGDDIGRANINGIGVNYEHVSLPSKSILCDVAIDRNYLYWADRGVDAIGRSDLDGSNADPEFIPMAERPCGVAVNGTHVYWTAWGEGVIYRAGIDGLDPPEVVVAGGADPCGIALSQTHVFWADWESDFIARARLDGSEALSRFVVAEGPSTVAIHADRLYWGNTRTHSVGTASLDGADVNQRLLSHLKHPWAVAVDGVQLLPEVQPPPQMSDFRIGKIKRGKRGSVVFLPLDFPGWGVFEATAPGAKLRIVPDSGRFINPGRKWLRISRPKKDVAEGQCIRDALRRGQAVWLWVHIKFSEIGKLQVSKHKRVRLFRSSPDLFRETKRRVVSCTG
jgi:hypothetical protein